MDSDAALTVQAILPILACLIVYWRANAEPNLKGLRIAFGGLAILAVVTLVGVLDVARRDPEILIPALGSVPQMLSIPAFFALMTQTPSRRAISFAFAVAAIIVAVGIYGAAAALFVGAFLAESGGSRRVGASLFLPLLSAAAYMAIAVKALLSARGGLAD